MNRVLKRSLAILLTSLTPFFGVSAKAQPPAIWGAEFIVSPMSLNSTGFVSWLKIFNPGAESLTITADISWTLWDGTTDNVELANLGSVAAGAITTISEATILTAIGDPTQGCDVSLTLTLANPGAIVLAEKKASDGRLPIKVERRYLLAQPAS